ncbi:hypothetical protein PIB30_008073 [Stylosanthes scabra]|uniref:Uncharacterized protein n=1 Tax=Stylosanthes scabra TaxID=79078 RepID=A0ABU6W2V9_9FABA|nr:hypothetical protein [Stylosanthes scabra]
MPEGTRRPRWDWFQEMFGELPDENDRDPCTMTFSWLKSRFGDLPRDASDDLVLRHARKLELGLTFASSLSAVHQRARSIQLGVRSACLAVQEYVPSSQQECRPGSRATGFAAELDFLAGFWWYRYLPTSDEKKPRLKAHRRQLNLMPFSEFVYLPYRTLEVEAVLDRSILQEDHRALWTSIVPLIYFGTIEWHQDGRGSDRWFPQTYQRWHALWATSLIYGLWACKFDRLFDVAQSVDPDPLQTSFSGGSSPLTSTLSRRIISIVCQLTPN